VQQHFATILTPRPHRIYPLVAVLRQSIEINRKSTSPFWKHACRRFFFFILENLL